MHTFDIYVPIKQSNGSKLEKLREIFETDFEWISVI